MNLSIQEKLEEVKKYNQRISELGKLSSLAYWDMKMSMPSKATEQRASTLGFLSGEIFKMVTSDKVKEFIDFFEPIMNELDLVDRSMIKVLKKSYYEIKNIPQDKFEEYTVATSLGEAAWEEAKAKKDFEIFKPKLENIVSLLREFTEYYGYEENRYDALLNQYEEGLTVKKIDKLFNELKEGILNLLSRIKNSNKVVTSELLEGLYSIEAQKELSEYLLDVIKFDKEAGRLDETTHPFTLNMGNKDVRITTHYYEDNLLSNIFSIIHEGGHALYEQHIPDTLINTGLDGGASMGIHESQSRFYENIVGRSKEFLSFILPHIKEKFPSLSDITLEEFYEGVNCVKPSLIRIEADELTYSLHIIIRYEIEKALINGEIEVEDLPKVWNKKYEEYLGVSPKDDEEGVLQDMHWSAGNIGYFPSYALGNLYGGQFLNTMLKDNPRAITEVVNGDLTYINNWLKDNIHVHGGIYTPDELVRKVTGEELKTRYFLDYLEEKYTKLYDLK